MAVRHVVWILCASLFGTVATGATVVGRTPGSFDVSTAGAATYNVPLWTAPGIGALQLNLALNYSSRAPSGAIGLGWSISGLSSITRCTKTWAQDGTPSPITLSSADALCLDGQRLRPTGGSGGSTFQTEIETYARVTANGSAGNGPQWFRVERPDGIIYEYGSTPDSRIVTASAGTVRVWALSKIKDRVGNSINYIYSNDSTTDPTQGGYRIARIEYPVTVSGGGPYNRVLFNYVTRPAADIVTGYAAGQSIREPNQLASIDVQSYVNGWISYRKYNLGYSQSASSSRLELTTVTECVATDCLAPTTISYQLGQAGWAASGTPAGDTTSKPSLLIPLDLNGDGKTDLLYPKGSGPNYNWYVMFGVSSGVFSAPLSTGVVSTATDIVIPGDFAGTGRTDVLYPQSGNWWRLYWNGTALVRVSTATAISTSLGSSLNSTAADINGDGLPDLVFVVNGFDTSGTLYFRLNTTTPGGSVSFAAPTLGYSLPPVDGQGNAWKFGAGPNAYQHWVATQRIGVADFNADGRNDLLVFVFESSGSGGGCPTCIVTGGSSTNPVATAAVTFNAAWRVLYATGSGFSEGISRPAASPINGGPSAFPLAVDWNGDGCSDFAYPSQGVGYWAVNISNCSSGFAESFTSIPWDLTQVMALDYDGDGRSDLLANAGGKWGVLRSDGISASTTVIDTGISLGSDAWFVGDFEGDGQDDLAKATSTDNNKLKVFPHNSPQATPDLAISFTDGFGVAAAPIYALQTDTTAYTPYATAIYPLAEQRNGLALVKSVSLTDRSGLNTAYTKTYSYEGGRIDRQGRGFVGFAKRVQIDGALQYNLKTEEIFRQDYPFYGAPSRITVKQSSGQVIRDTNNTWDKLTTSAPDLVNRRDFPYVLSTTTNDFEMGGIYNGVQIRSTLSRVDGIDIASGLVTDSTTTVQEVGATGLNSGYTRSERMLHTGVLNDFTNWCLGRPTATQVTGSSTVPGVASITRSSGASWDGLYCRPTTQSIEPGNPTWGVTIGLLYDSLGNPSRRTVTGAGMIDRPTSINWGTRGQFPESITNAMSEVTQRTWDYAQGVPLTALDPNGLPYSWTYDNFGRRKTEARPDNTSTAWSYSTCTIGCDARVKYQIQQDEKDNTGVTYRTSVRLFDRWDTPDIEQTQTLSPGEYSVIASRALDAKGRVTREYVPYIAGGADNGYTQSTYDALNRVQSSSLYKAGNVLDRTTGYTYNGLSTVETDPLTHATTRVATAWGDLVRVMDALNGPTNFAFDSFGALTRVTDANGNNVLQNVYNVRGMRTQSIDIDAGTKTFVPDALGELLSQTDSKSQSVTFTYDLVGRMTTRDEAEGKTTWEWGTSSAARNIGRVYKVSRPAPEAYSETYTYDNQAGRLASRSITSDATYQYQYAYNSIGTLDTLTYPASTGINPFKVKYGYTNGYATSVQDVTGGVSGSILWNLNLTDARFNPISETYGNGLWMQNAYDKTTGLAATRKAGTGGLENNVQNLSYVWDKADNLTQRSDSRQALTEDFGYDELNRLKSGKLNQVSTINLSYDLIGNITCKSDLPGGNGCPVGTTNYTYNATKKHAVASAGGVAYLYDANGNMSSRAGAAIAWTSYDLPSMINDPSGYSAQFKYATDRSRWRQISTYQGGTETTTYIGGLMEKLVTPARTHWKHIVLTPSGQVQYIRRSDGTLETLYFATDHLGSSDVLMNAAGVVLVRPSFDAFGARRNGTTWLGAPSASDWQSIANYSRRGFTGHEHLDDVNLIHMNGRVYDPRIGRFLSADPLIADIGDGQSINAYSYVDNRPLSNVDPSGYSPWAVPIKIIVGPFHVGTLGGGAGGSAEAGASAGGGAAAAAQFGAYAIMAFAVYKAIMTIQEPPAPPRTVIGGSAQGGGQTCTPGNMSIQCGGGLMSLSPTGGGDQRPQSSTSDWQWDAESNARIAEMLNHGITWVGDNLTPMPFVLCVFNAGLNDCTPTQWRHAVISVVTMPVKAEATAVKGVTGAIGAVERGVSVLGHEGAYQELGKRIGARYLDVARKYWNKMSEAEQWAANQRFLDRLIRRGDVVVLATPVAEARAGSWFARELKYLTERGYTLSADGTRMLPPLP